ncbi:sensor histidine kinase [Fischerella thermalis CCMEE 5273]|nr:HAMP domain-containing sensor histidine kinase [Chlorogloeopsis fritschii]PMB10730.1 sensor histidine kinase [Fischerella thermalis CCMEE 5273]PMB40459.1 sensor histidine kinase [Fischerella thermalis CCMEE 5205]
MLYKILVIGRRRNQIVARIVDSLQQPSYMVITKSTIPNTLENIDLIVNATFKLATVYCPGKPVIKVVQSADDLNCASDFDDFLVYPFAPFELLRRVDLCLCRHTDYLRKLPQYLEILSHDVYHPLKAVNFVLGLAKAGNYSHSPEQLHSVLDTSCSTITTALGILAELKSELSFLSGSKIESINISKLLHSIHAQFLDYAIAQYINFTLLVEPEAIDICIYANYNHLWRMVCNLVVNAFKYTKWGGFVNIKLDSQVAGFLRLTVQDTGMGMTPMQLQQLNVDLGGIFLEDSFSIISPEVLPTVDIFAANGKRFTQQKSLQATGDLDTKRSRKPYERISQSASSFMLNGTESHVTPVGLGLRTVKYVADCYQASVSVSSKVGEGSKFCVIFNLEANFQCYSTCKHLTCG